MPKQKSQLDRAPIVEAVIDMDCDMPPKFDLKRIEDQAKQAYSQEYRKSRIQYIEEHKIESRGIEPAQVSARRGIQALQFLHEDEKQLVQVRSQGFSFNRLAPYTSLDDYLPAIRDAWERFLAIGQPVQIRVVRLRYINRILIPMREQKVELSDYFKLSPRLPEEDRLVLNGFFNQFSVVEPSTGHEAKMVMTSQQPAHNQLPIIFDITVGSGKPRATDDWDSVLSVVASLRDLKNRIFRNSLTDKCLNLFQAQ